MSVDVEFSVCSIYRSAILEFRVIRLYYNLNWYRSQLFRINGVLLHIELKLFVFPERLDLMYTELKHLFEVVIINNYCQNCLLPKLEIVNYTHIIVLIYNTNKQCYLFCKPLPSR